MTKAHPSPIGTIMFVSLNDEATIKAKRFILFVSLTDEATIKAKRFILFVSLTDEATIKAKRFICILKESRCLLSLSPSW